jgi:hypothetical protein
VSWESDQKYFDCLNSALAQVSTNLKRLYIYD